MDMKKVSTAIIVAAASMSAVMAADAPAPSPSAGPDSSVAAATLPVLGSLVGASIVSLFSYILQ
uniref:Arabinogalactan peptide 23-like n=1 Tax=Gossypium raimondii TaxID=29730 RepID=A0A0D2T617_GOSRA|nr:hypothetical protein B456_007G358400 [Gossypium raimondii]